MLEPTAEAEHTRSDQNELLRNVKVRRAIERGVKAHTLHRPGDLGAALTHDVRAIEKHVLRPAVSVALEGERVEGKRRREANGEETWIVRVAAGKAAYAHNVAVIATEAVEEFRRRIGCQERQLGDHTERLQNRKVAHAVGVREVLLYRRVQRAQEGHLEASRTEAIERRRVGRRADAGEASEEGRCRGGPTEVIAVYLLKHQVERLVRQLERGRRDRNGNNRIAIVVDANSLIEDGCLSGNFKVECPVEERFQQKDVAVVVQRCCEDVCRTEQKALRATTGLLLEVVAAVEVVAEVVVAIAVDG